MAHILIVEDDPHIRRLICVNLQARGFEITEAADGKTALQIVYKTALDGLILDIKLPDMEGWDVLHTLMQDERLTAVPTVIITAGVKDEVTEKILKYPNIVARIYKPLSIDDLIVLTTQMTGYTRTS